MKAWLVDDRNLRAGLPACVPARSTATMRAACCTLPLPCTKPPRHMRGPAQLIPRPAAVRMCIRAVATLPGRARARAAQHWATGGPYTVVPTGRECQPAAHTHTHTRQAGRQAQGLGLPSAGAAAGAYRNPNHSKSAVPGISALLRGMSHDDGGDAYDADACRQA